MGAFEDLIDKATAFASGDTSLDKGTHAYFAPSSEPLDWQTKGKVVRLDVAIYGLHLMAARVAFRSLPGQIRQQQLALKRAVATWIGKKLAFQFLGAVANAIIESLKIVEAQFRAEDVQKQMEQAIRRQSIIVQRDLFKNALGKSKRERKKRAVWTRHGKPKKK